METQKYVDNMLAEMLRIAKVRFGSTIKGFWFYAGNGCPGCQDAISTAKYKGEEALSLNAFIYRKTGILIGYCLCKRCARQIFQAAQQNPMVETPLHGKIEENLIAAYQRHISSLAA